MSDARVEALEVKVAFQEDLLNALNDVVVRQDQRIDSLEKSLENYRRRLEGLLEHGIDAITDTKPPHY